MINGKFFAGLPPDMIDRGGSAGGSRGKNRLESHLFWPDDTQSISATDMCLKRPNRKQNRFEPSQQNEQQGDVNTRKMFHREFAKSSIHFYDNLEEEQPKRGPQKVNLKSCQLPVNLEDVSKSVDTAFMKAKRQQVFDSKIEFNDYAEDEVNKINYSKTILDKNDKKQLERNTKNSPKLQSKKNISITPNTKIMNDCRNYNRSEEKCPQDQKKKMLTNADERVGNNKQGIHNVSDDNLNSVMPSEIMRRDSRRIYANRGDPDEHSGQFEYSVNTNSSDYENNGLNYIQNNTKTLKIQSGEGTKIKHLYDQNNYDFEDYHSETNSDRFDRSDERNLMRRRGSYSGNRNIRSSPKRSFYPNDDAIVRGGEYEPYLESPSSRPTATPTHTNTYDNNCYNNRYGNDCSNDYVEENNHVQKQRGNIPRMLPNSTTSRTSKLQPVDEGPLVTQQRRNVSYASLSLKEGEDGRIYPSHASNYRRTARNSATQRISVGLPD